MFDMMIVSALTSCRMTTLSTPEWILAGGAMCMIILQSTYLVMRTCLRRQRDERAAAVAAAAPSTPPPSTPPSATHASTRDQDSALPYGDLHLSADGASGLIAVRIGGAVSPHHPVTSSVHAHTAAPDSDSVKSRSSTDLMDTDEMGGMLAGGMHCQNPNRT